MKVACLIPARYQSTRLPGKPLAIIGDKPMIQWVYEQVQKAKKADRIIVATDDERVLERVEAFGGEAVMTWSGHRTGTDRLAEVAAQLDDVDVIINVQGDEPLIEPEVIDDLITLFEKDPSLPMATVCAPLGEGEAAMPSVVKVVCNLRGDALYFSRSLIPYPREGGSTPKKHIGIYGYGRDFLLAYAAMEPTPLEEVESLEQLRALEHGYTIRVIETDQAFHGVDTPEDLAAVNAIVHERAVKDE